MPYCFRRDAVLSWLLRNERMCEPFDKLWFCVGRWQLIACEICSELVRTQLFKRNWRYTGLQLDDGYITPKSLRCPDSSRHEEQYTLRPTA